MYIIPQTNKAYNHNTGKVLTANIEVIITQVVTEIGDSLVNRYIDEAPTAVSHSTLARAYTNDRSLHETKP